MRRTNVFDLCPTLPICPPGPSPPTPSSRLFHPASGEHVPLDVLAGVTPKDSSHGRNQCLTEEGPLVRLHLQKDPRTGGNVGVVVLENHLSPEYMVALPSHLEQLKFQAFGSGTDKYLRVSTTVTTGEPPLMTFGNNDRSQTFYQATTQAEAVEVGILKMTTYVHRVVDGVLGTVKAILLHHHHRAEGPREGPGRIAPSHQGTTQERHRSAQDGAPVGAMEPMAGEDDDNSQRRDGSGGGTRMEVDGDEGAPAAPHGRSSSPRKIRRLLPSSLTGTRVQTGAGGGGVHRDGAAVGNEGTSRAAVTPDARSTGRREGATTAGAPGLPGGPADGHGPPARSSHSFASVGNGDHATVPSLETGVDPFGDRIDNLDQFSVQISHDAGSLVSEVSEMSGMGSDDLSLDLGLILAHEGAEAVPGNDAVAGALDGPQDVGPRAGGAASRSLFAAESSRAGVHSLHLGKDHPDSLAWHATKTKPYGHHSDTRGGKKGKPCNHDNTRDASHEDRMRIFTHGYAYPVDREGDVPDRLVTIRHGYPGQGGSEDEMCAPYGHFSSQEGGMGRFVRWQEGQDKAIAMGTACHAHLQLPGSQGPRHHFIDAVPFARRKDGKKQEVLRIIASARQFAPFRRDQPGMAPRWPRVDESSVVRNVCHTQDDVVGRLRGETRALPTMQRDGVPGGVPTGDGRQTATEDRPNRPNRPNRPTQTLEKFDRRGHFKCNPDGRLACEQFRRDAVVGAPSSVTPNDVMRSASVARAMMREQCSMRVTLEGCTAPLMVGPMVAECVDGGGSSYEVLTPGIPYSPSAVNQWGRLQSSTHNRGVVNEATGDLLHLHREGKNSASVLKNVQCCVNGKGQLEPMTLRGTGGALCLAGQNMMNSHSRGSTREAPTHIVSPGQKWTTLSRVMDDCCLQERVMNVFYQGIYIGPFFVSETAQKRLTSTEAAREARDITAALGALHLTDSVAFPSGTPRSGTDHEMASMKAVSRFFTLTPLDVDFVESYGKLANKADRKWSLVNVGPEDFVIPMHSVPKDEVNEQFGEKFVDVHSLIQEAEGLSFLTDAAIERELPHRVGEVHGGTVYDARGARLNAGQLESAIFHAAGVTVAKTGCEGVVRHSDGCMSPPRAILWDNGIGTEEGRVAEYARELEQRNLKPVMMKAVHPCHLGHEPAAWLAMVSTGSCDPELREREEVGGQWVPTRRHGTNFVLQERTRAEATQIMFQAALCAMTCPATLVNVDLALRQRGLLHEDSPPTMVAPRPGTAHYHAFMAMQRTHDIGNAIVHPTFKTKIGREPYIELVSGLERSGGNIFVRAVEEARVGGRNAAVKALLADLNELLDGDEVVLSEFHVQVIMRTIEMCLHEPFGPVTAVPMGSGSKGAAMCFRETWNGHATTSARTEEFHLVAEVDAVVASSSMPARIVVHLNEWARKALREGDDAERTRMQKVLRVLDLEWSDDAECLVHALGIGKRFDVSDAEHTLCLIFTLHQATLPSRTISKGYEVDSAKVFPIRVNVGEVAAGELPCMAKFLDGWEGRLTAYQDLLKDVDFDHQSLPDIFRIDSTSPEEVGDTARGGGGGAGGGGNAVRREEVGCANRDEIPNAGSRAFPRVEGDPEDANGVEAGAVRRGDDDDDDDNDNDDDDVPRVPVRFPAWRYGGGNRHERAYNAPNDESGPADVDEEMADAVVGGAGVWTGDVLGMANEASVCLRRITSAEGEPGPSLMCAELDLRLMLVPSQYLEGFDNSAALVQRKAALHAMQESNNSFHVGAFEEV